MSSHHAVYNLNGKTSKGIWKILGSKKNHLWSLTFRWNTTTCPEDPWMRLDTKDARAQISRRRKSQGMHLAVAVICKFNSNYRHSSISGIFSILRGLLFYLSFFPFSTTKKPWFTQFSLSAFFFMCPHINNLNQGMPVYVKLVWRIGCRLSSLNYSLHAKRDIAIFFVHLLHCSALKSQWIRNLLLREGCSRKEI